MLSPRLSKLLHPLEVLEAAGTNYYQNKVMGANSVGATDF
jgi:hypothetical protein